MNIKIPFIGEVEIGVVKKTKTVADPNGGPAMNVSTGRSSDPDLPTTLWSILQEEAALVTPEYQIELIGVLEYLGKFNPDISYAIDNIVQLGNTPYDISFNDGLSEKQIKEARAEIMRMQKEWYAFSGGIVSLRNDLLAQAAVTGAVSGEIVPNDRLDGVKRIVIVTPKNIRFAYNKVLGAYQPYQKLQHNLLQGRRDIADNGMIKLNPTTYKYYAVRRFNESPYSIPPFLAALDSITIEKDMVDNFRHIIKKLGVLGFLQTLVTAPKKKQNETDDQYEIRCEEYLKRVATEVDKGIKKGYVAGFEGLHKFEMKQTTSNVTGATDLLRTITEMKMAGVKQDPLMLGRNYSTTETVGRVILAKLSAQLQNYQMLIDQFLADAFYLDLVLAGFKYITSVHVESKKPLLADESKEQDAFSKKIDNYDKLYQQGVISQVQRANALGWEKPDQDEPRATVAPAIPGAPGEPDNTDTEGNLNPNNDNSKTEDATDTQDENLIRLPEKVLAALKREKQLVLHIDVEIAGKGYQRLELVNGEYVRSDGFSTGDINEFYFDSDQLTEALDTAADTLHADVQPFDYTVECCGHTHTEDLTREEFARDKNLNKYIDKYGKPLKNNYSRAVGKVAAKVTKELGRFNSGVSLQEVQDAVLYVIFKNWPDEFTKKNRKYINKWVQDTYKFFRGDKSVFPDPSSIPDATFSLKDLRTISYYKNSDSLYLGKFITDPDTKARVTEYIKQKYLEEALPINDKKNLAVDFKAEFGETLLKERYKIDRIISTTVNKMRNTAAVNYMDQAGVEKFVIVGIKDRLQCAYCAELNGKEFEVSAALSQTSSLSASSPEEVAEKSPFATSVFKGQEGLNELKGLTPSQIQAKGVALPGYHCNCRCAISAVL